MINYQLTYKNSFIDVDIVRCRVLRRSKSMPAPRRYVEDVGVQKDASYVSSLLQRSEQLKLVLRIPTMKTAEIMCSAPAESGCEKKAGAANSTPVETMSLSGKSTAIDSGASTFAPDASAKQSAGHCLALDTLTSLAEERIESSSMVSAPWVHSPSPSQHGWNGRSYGHDLSTNARSAGSAGHPELCRRPCMFVVQGTCKDGVHCCFCHLGHKTQNLDKRHREHLRSLRQEDRLSLVSQLLQERAMATGYSSEMAEVMEIIAEWRAALPQSRVESQALSPHTLSLQKVMSRMPLNTLIGYSFTKTNPSEFSLRLMDAMQRVFATLVSQPRIESK
eukprot:TRINITY_DN93508_c0_g1_i1.p1 TRINITY_DN93508_c0_g1~~TRINITY_DN93508_c0_g1_i1.p1  ORF type:complete len:334 (-),score=57.62 TRINITY_DN93508_c0_g1_i1:220-1221(-)